MDCSTPGLPLPHHLLKFAQVHVIASVMPSSHLILWQPLLLCRSFPASGTFPMSQLFPWDDQNTEVSALASVFPTSIQGWFDLLAVQGTLRSLLQHHSLKASVLQCSALFPVQLSQPYVTIGKTIALTRQTFVGKVMSLLFNMLSRLVIAFLPRSKCLLISWLQSSSAVVLEPKKIKSVTVSIVSPSICHEVIGPDAMILVFLMLSFKPDFSLLFHFHQEAL